MSDLGFNKIAFCVLGTGLLLIGLNEASHALFHNEHHETDAYFVEIPDAPEAGAATAVAEGPRDYFALLSAASVAAGEEVAVKCHQCHTFEPGGEALQGPNLYGIVGRNVASVAGFKYSTGPGSLSDLEGVWDYEKLDHFIERPKGYRPATAMNFLGIRKEADRANLMAYLRTLTAGEPLPLPPPLPEATEVAATEEGAVPTDPSAPSQGEAGAPDAAAPDAATSPAEGAPAQTDPAQPVP